MNNMYKVFGCYTDLQLNNIFNKLDMTVTEMINMDDIVENNLLSVDEKRAKLLEMFSYSPCVDNYPICEEVFKNAKEKEDKNKQLKESKKQIKEIARKPRPLKEDVLPNNNETTQLNMNQTIELNSLFELASEKFKKVNCSQQFYDLLSQKTSKNIANAFFNMLKSIPEDSECRFDPQLVIDGRNFAETISPFVNELKTFLNGCKAETKKEEVKEDYNADKLSKIDHQIAQLENNLKKFEQEKNSYLDEYSKLEYKLDKSRLRKLKTKREEYLNESDSKKIDESLEDTLNNFKYYITTSNNKKELNFMKDKLEILFNQANDVNLQNEISEILSMINSKLNKTKPIVDECCDIDSLLEPFKPTVINITINDDGCLEDNEKELCANSMKALASHINDEKDCCEENNIENMQTINSLLGTIANYFHTKLCESQVIEKNPYKGDTLADNAKASMWRPGEEELDEDLDNNIVYDPNKELEDIKERYLNKELDYYDAIKEVENITGNEKIAEEKVESWDDSSKHGLYGITDNSKMEDAIETVNAQIDDFGSYNDEYVRSICEDVAKANGVDVKKLYYYVTNEKWSAWDEDEYYDDLDEDTVYDHSWYEVKGQKYPKRTKNGVEIKESKENDIEKIHDDFLKGKINGTEAIEQLDDCPQLKSEQISNIVDKWIDERDENELNDIWDNDEFDEDNDVLNDILSDLDKYLDDNNSINTETVCDVIEKNMRKNNIPDESFDDLFAEVNDKLVSHDIRMTDEKLDEMCSGGACCAGAVATVPSPAKPKTPKRKHKRSKVDEMALNMFKRQIIEDVNSQFDANGNHYEFKNGYLYINGNIARTKSKFKMFEALDEMLELETLPGFNSSEMLMLEDIEANGSVGNEDDNNQNDSSNNNNNDNNNNNQQNINQDNLGDVNQNVTQDNDLTPEQRQMKQDNEKVLDQSMNSGSDTNVSLNQGFDNNNDQTSSTQTTSDNVKYKVIGKDDSDSNNIKYIIQDPDSKKTMVVDATKLRLEK